MVTFAATVSITSLADMSCVSMSFSVISARICWMVAVPLAVPLSTSVVLVRVGVCAGMPVGKTAIV